MFTFIAVVWGLLVLFRLESALRRQQESLDGIERMLKQVAEQPAPSKDASEQDSASSKKKSAAKKPVQKKSSAADAAAPARKTDTKSTKKEK